MKKILLEALAVAVIGGGLSLLANQLSPRGLQLGRNYFPKPVTNVLASTSNAVAGATTGTNLPDPAQVLAARLEAQGISLANSNQVVEWFGDPRYQTGQIVFIDARDDAHYQGGHIPGAYQFNYYQPEAHMPAVLQAGQTADVIVIYCNGGNCEDSEFTARMLASAFPPQKLFVYAGGIEEWSTNSLPIELGARNSGSFRASN